jgi:poly(3-hydroxybutyrate) depolymerase
VTRGVWSTAQTIAFWRRINGCINNGGHRMPGSFPDARFMRAVNLTLGPQNHDIDGAETIWDFFRGFP